MIFQMISNLGGQSKVDHAFKRTAPKSQALLELSLRPGNPFAHPIPGDVVGTNNLLLKVTKRKRKQVTGEPCTTGEYTAEVVGAMIFQMFERKYQCMSERGLLAPTFFDVMGKRDISVKERH